MLTLWLDFGDEVVDAMEAVEAAEAAGGTKKRNRSARQSVQGLRKILGKVRIPVCRARWWWGKGGGCYE